MRTRGLGRGRTAAVVGPVDVELELAASRRLVPAQVIAGG